MNSQPGTVLSTPTLLLWLVLLIVPLPGVAKSPNISVTGNERTETEFVVELTRTCINNLNGPDSEIIDRKALKECILNSKLFSDVEITLAEETLTVTVDERWSLIPIPIIKSQSDQDTSFGLFLLETNFLGLGKTAIVGGTFSGQDESIFVLYEDPAVFQTNWKIRFSAGVDNTQFHEYKEEDKIDGMDEKNSFFNGLVGYRFFPELTGSLLFGRSSYQYETFESYVRPEDFSAGALGLELKWDRSDYKFYYQEGLQLEVTLTKQLERSDDDDLTDESMITVDWQFSLFADQALQWKFVYGVVHKADQRTALRVGGKIGTRGIPDKGVWADEYATLSLDYQIPILSGSSGTWTIAPFVDSGFIKANNENETVVNYTAGGLGTYFFLKQINVPGIGFFVGTNPSYTKQFYSLSIGFAF